MASSYGEDASKQALRNGYLSLSSNMSPALRRRVDAEVRDHLKACPAYREASLVLGGVLEPVCGTGVAPVNGDELEESVCLVPGLVFDSKGYRVGYGAGYYDNFLSHYRGTKIGLARTMQLSGNPLPSDPHDVPVDVIVSDGAVWMCR